jgi:hypothetical protein
MIVKKRREKEMDEKIKKQVEKVLASIATEDEVAEIEKVIQEAKGKIQLESYQDFWVGKTPCWEMFRCPEELKRECPAFNNRSVPCWEVEGTYCKLFDYGTKGDGTDICQHCRVYKRWGNSGPIEIKVRGKGIHAIG